MSKIRDALANDVKSMGFVQAFQEGWDSALKNACEVKALVEAAELGLSFAPKGEVPKDLAPMFYHTLNYNDEVKLQERIDKAREALTQWKESIK